MQDPQSRRWSLKGELIKATGIGESWDVKLDNGKVARRNARFIKPVG